RRARLDRAAVRTGPKDRVPAGRAGLDRLRLLRLSDGARGVRHPGVAPLVCGLGHPGHADLPLHAGRTASAGESLNVWVGTGGSPSAWSSRTAGPFTIWWWNCRPRSWSGTSG